MFYALSDKFTGHNPENTTSGFANTKCVIAFNTKKERDEWLEDTRLLTARALTRDEALKEIDWSRDSYLCGEYDKAKACEIYGSNDHHILIGKNY